MADQTAKQAKNEHIQKMGQELGEQFAQLWQELTYLHANWNEYVVLFGTKPERIKLLNEANSSFFRMLQDELWAATLLHIAKLTDQPVTGGQKNLTFRNFSHLIGDAEFKKKIAVLIDEIIAHTKFAKQWRNKRIAHLDLKLALDNGAAEELEGGSRQQVKESLELMAKLMNTVAQHHHVAPTAFHMANRNGAIGLIYLLDEGLRARAKQYERLQKGEPPQEDDFPERDL